MKRSVYIFILLIATACGSSTEETESNEFSKQEEASDIDSLDLETEEMAKPSPEEHPVFDTYQEVRAYPTCLAVADSENDLIGR